MHASFIPYPMVEEEEAAGRVAAVYARVLEHSPFVPSLLKSLAVCPPYLVTAWEQAEAALAAPDFSETADRLAASVRDAASPPSDPGDCELLRGFLDPLGRMLLLSCGLLAALRGEITGVRSADRGAPPWVGERLRRSVSSASELEAASVFARIRATLDTPIHQQRLAPAGRGGTPRAGVGSDRAAGPPNAAARRPSAGGGHGCCPTVVVGTGGRS